MERGPWYRYDFSQKTEYLIVGFGSVRMFKKTKKRGFEWDNLLKYKFSNLKFNRIFVGDIRNSWWHTEYEGLQGCGPYILANFLNEKIKEAGATKTLYLGVSMGGYGAILFGCLTNATKVMAFSPQTLLTEGRRERQLNVKFECYDIDETLTDLKRVLEEKGNVKTIYKIWYGEFNKGDTIAAKRISHLNNVFINPIKSAKHNVAVPVIKSGEFRKEVFEFFGKKME